MGGGGGSYPSIWGNGLQRVKSVNLQNQRGGRERDIFRHSESRAGPLINRAVDCWVVSDQVDCSTNRLQ